MYYTVCQSVLWDLARHGICDLDVKSPLGVGQQLADLDGEFECLYEAFPEAILPYPYTCPDVSHGIPLW